MTSRSQMFADIDRMDADAWAGHLASDAVMRSATPIRCMGETAAAMHWQRFMSRSRGCRITSWGHGDATIVEANVTYKRRDGGEVTVPVVTIYRTNGKDLIADYRVYVDLAPVFA